MFVVQYGVAAFCGSIFVYHRLFRLKVIIEKDFVAVFIYQYVDLVIGVIVVITHNSSPLCPNLLRLLNRVAI